MSNSKITVLVTGGSGFVGSHCVFQLLEAGYTVRTTVRNLSKAQYVRDMLRDGGLADPDTAALTFFAADLNADEGWAAAVSGCDYVLHVASPFPLQAPTDEDELIRPAREGTLRVLRAARDAKVKRMQVSTQSRQRLPSRTASLNHVYLPPQPVPPNFPSVVTSSVAAVAYGHAEKTATYDETAWSEVPNMVKAQAYMKSKTLAERSAWDLIESEGGGMEMTVVNPVGSVEIVRMILSGSMPAYPKIYSGLIDVRDVASLHLLAMTHEKAKNQRFIAVAGDSLKFSEMAVILKARLPAAAARRIWTSDLPDVVVRGAALVMPLLTGVVSELGKRHDVTSAKARELLGWKPRSNEEALVATAECLIARNLVDKKK
ncbi:hypothetical protein HK405_013991 [Cladochytrium tenue]|nr:hypothetical protein HK405_013991 [Cladochytrium tenue]